MMGDSAGEVTGTAATRRALSDHTDAKYDCGTAGWHVSSPADTPALVTAVGQSWVTCIKLQPGVVYSLSSYLYISRTVALVAEEGGATLDGGGSTSLLYLESAAAVVALFNLTLQNGLHATSFDNVRPTPRPFQRGVASSPSRVPRAQAVC